MTRPVTFTKAQVRRAIKAAESAGLRVRRVTVNPDGSITLDHRPMTEQEKIEANPLVKAHDAAKFARCATVQQFRLLVSEGIFPKGISNRKWDLRKLGVAIKQASIEPDASSIFGEIYFLETGGFIKIGYSMGADVRITQLQTASPYELILIGTIKGSLRNEEQLHSRLRHLRHRGEWFRKTNGLLAYIQWLRANAS